MTIGIDIDDTITNSAEKIREYAAVYFKGENLDEILNGPRIEGRLKEFLDEFVAEMMVNYTLKDNVKEVISRLKEKGHRIILITARGYSVGGELLNITLDYLKQHEIIYDEIVFKALDKTEACQKYGVDIMIDDYVKGQETLHQNGFRAIVFNSKKNQSKPTDLKRLDTWLEVEEYIDSMELL